MTKRRLIKRLWPQSLTAQLVCLLLGAIILTHIVLGVMLAEERRDAVASERRGYALSRVAAISRILTTTPRDNWADVLRVAQSSQNRLRLVSETDLQAGDGFVSDSLTHRLNEALSLENGIPARVEILSEDDCWDEHTSLRRDKEDYLERNYPQRPDDDDEDDNQGKRVDDHHHRDDDRRAPWSMR